MLVRCQLGSQEFSTIALELAFGQFSPYSSVSVKALTK